MGVLIPAVLPVLPGQTDRVRNFQKELEPHRQEWERLNKEATLRDVHGVDMRRLSVEEQPTPPPPLFTWPEG